MDGMREGGERGGESDAQVMAAVGSDERRMHVRAYNYWVSLLKGRAYPSVKDLEPSELADFGPHSVLLDFSAGIENPGVAYLGARLREECGIDQPIASIADVPSRSLLSRLTDHYLQIIANRAPIGFEAEFNGRRGHQTLYRGILMPFSSDDDAIDFIYGVINWKELADPVTQAALSAEVGAALAAPAAAPASDLPVFADGPSAVGSTTAAPAITAPVPVGYDAGEEEETPEPLGPDAGVADWLVAARDCAAAATAADGRSRAALYAALGLAYDFAVVAGRQPDDYAELLDDAGIKPQARAPMTPIVKLVFGVNYDKTRLTEFAAALSHGMRRHVAQGSFTSFLEEYRGGLKGIVQAERALRRPSGRVPPDPAGKLRAAPSLARVDGAVAGDGEFVLLVARRDGAGLSVIGALDGQGALAERALREVAAGL